MDRLVIDSSFTDEDARLNALLSGSVNAVPVFPFLMAKQQQGGGLIKVLRASGPNTYYLPMRVDKGPVADVRVRQAMKILVDGQALIDGALAGFGTVANDLPGRAILTLRRLSSPRATSRRRKLC